MDAFRYMYPLSSGVEMGREEQKQVLHLICAMTMRVAMRVCPGQRQLLMKRDTTLAFLSSNTSRLHSSCWAQGHITSRDVCREACVSLELD